MRAWKSIGAAFAVAVAAGAGPAAADQKSSEAWFSAKTLAQRTLLQAELILAGEYSGLADGNFGGATYQALAAYQTHRSFPAADGVLTAAEEADLQERAVRAYGILGMRTQKDAVTGMSVPLPMGLLMMSAPSEFGTTWTAGVDSGLAVTLQAVPEKDMPLKALYTRLTEGTGRSVFGAEFKPDRFRVAGADGNARDFFAGYILKDGVSRGVIVSWLPRLQLLGPIAAAYLVSVILSPSIGAADAFLLAEAAKLPPTVPPPPAATVAPGPALPGVPGLGLLFGIPPAAPPAVPRAPAAPR